MSMSQFDCHKVDYLFLLIGENPLPNYVAARLLLKDQKLPAYKRTLYLIHTTWTEAAAKRLKNILKFETDSPNLSDEEIQLLSINDDESDAYRIKKKIREELNHISAGSIGLNYTGGTKAMSVHSYRALFYEQPDKSKEQYTKRQDVVFSYLNARRLEMCIDREDGERDSYKVTPELLQVSLDKIFKLHGWQEWTSEATTYTSKLNNAAEAFAKFYHQLDDAQEWREWCRKTFKDEYGNWKKGKGEQAVDLDRFKSRTLIKDALDQFGITENTSRFKDVDFKTLGFKKIGNIYDWLDGTWLEHFVFLQAKKISNGCCIRDCDIATSIYIKEPNSSNNNKCEIDVAFMRGYQLFAISCTTAILPNQNKKLDLYKNKLFEAYIRSRQIGGDEARVALVCPVDKKGVTKLETEILNVLNSEPESLRKDHKIKVFGREDFMDLSTKIKTWIEQVDRETR